METSDRLSVRELQPMKVPAGITEDYIDCRASCGLTWHVLKAGDPGKPLVLFCHGYPELAYSWRKVLPRVAEAGYYCVAMDQRGYGRTMGWPRQPFYEVELNDYVFTNLVRDLVCLVYNLGYTEVFSIVGHDFRGVSSAIAALMRPDIFRSTIQLSHPHHAPPTPPFGDQLAKPKLDIQTELAKLDPPRKHYKWYNSTPEAASDWDNPPLGLEKFLRGYFYLKSADWTRNNPRTLKGWNAQALEVMPEYYVMRKELSMPETVGQNMESEDYTKSERWLSREDPQTATTPLSARDMLLYAGRRIEVPCTFINGNQDWGNCQQPGAIESYKDPKTVKPGCFRGSTLINGAGHWVQQEQPEAVIQAILSFFRTL
ncbi:alpha/beta-hydrolase [Xylariaceae sp. FL1651]|nr:alpha/beta-hydrolase [Xylariaceae sp. FL1651]